MYSSSTASSVSLTLHSCNPNSSTKIHCISIAFIFHHSNFLSYYDAALFRMEFSGRGELSERQQKLGQHLGHLVRLAEEFNIAIVVVSVQSSCISILI